MPRRSKMDIKKVEATYPITPRTDRENVAGMLQDVLDGKARMSWALLKDAIYALRPYVLTTLDISQMKPGTFAVLEIHNGLHPSLFPCFVAEVDDTNGSMDTALTLQTASFTTIKRTSVYGWRLWSDYPRLNDLEMNPWEEVIKDAEGDY